MNPNEQPPQYDLEKARAEADEMEKMITEGEARDYEDAGEEIEKKEKQITSIEQLMEEEKKFLKRVDELEAEGLDGRKLNTSEFWEKLGEAFKKTSNPAEDHYSDYCPGSNRADQRYFVGESQIHDIISYSHEIYLRFLSHNLESRGILSKGSLDDLRKSTYGTIYYPNEELDTDFVENELTEIQKQSSEKIKFQLEKIPENKKVEAKEVIFKTLMVPSSIGDNNPDQKEKEVLEYFRIDENVIKAYKKADVIAGIISHTFPKAIHYLGMRHPLLNRF